MTASTRGLMLGTLGVLVFSLTMPVTRLALSDGALSPWFVAAGRAVLAAAAGAIYLIVTQSAMPPRSAWMPLLGATMGIVLGWPLLSTLALQTAPASHAAVLNGVLPLITAIIGAGLTRETLPQRFWVCAIAGSCLVSAYAWWRGGAVLTPADGLLLLSLPLGGLGYAAGAIAARHMPGPAVISWALLLGLPLTLPLALYSTPNLAEVPIKSWLAWTYLGLMSQWVGFFFWYRGLALGGIARVSQVQLMQLFATLAFSALLLNERIDAVMLIVAALTLALILIGRRA